jgi:subtilisin family serine protease
MFKKNPTKKLTAILIGSILMPVFLLGITPAMAEPSDFDVNIVFGVSENKPVTQFSHLARAQFLFGGNGLPDTYKTTVKQSDYLLMKSDSYFSYVEIDREISVAKIITDDPYFTVDPDDDSSQWYLEKIRIPDAWEHGKGSAQTKVAVIDTGVHADHLDLNDGRVLEGFNVLEGIKIPANSNSDDNGHGTAVSGVIGAISNNGRGVAGINWQVGIIPVKALAGNGAGTISSVASGIVWAANNGAHIINLSLGGPGFGDDQTLNNSIIYAYNSGSVIVAAAGNDLADNGINLDTSPTYPICADGGNNMVIGVTATDIDDKKASFANYGVNCVDIAAPGKRILTTTFLPTDPADNILIYGSGTSLATPVVSGVAALLKSNHPTFSNHQIKNIILNTADNIDSLNQNSCLGSSCNGYLGHGRINALSALSPQPLLEGDIVKESATGKLYYITGGRKRYVSDFVFRQRGFNQTQIVFETNNQLANLQLAPAFPPLEGTLIKGQTDPTVYYIHQELKRPLTYLVFQSRSFSFASVQTLPESDVNVLTIGEWYWPPDGTMILIKGDPTVYVMEDGVKRPVTYFVFTQRRLSFARVVTVTTDEFGHIPKAPDTYWLPPLDGTLVKADSDSTVYLIVDGTKRPITYEAFVARKLSFANVKSLPKVELDVIAPGALLK